MQFHPLKLPLFLSLLVSCNVNSLAKSAAFIVPSGAAEPLLQQGLRATDLHYRTLAPCNINSLHKYSAVKMPSQSRQGRQNVAHGVSRGSAWAPSPPSPLPLARERGAEGGVRAVQPRAYALGHMMSPLTGLGSRLTLSTDLRYRTLAPLLSHAYQLSAAPLQTVLAGQARPSRHRNCRRKRRLDLLGKQL